MSDFETRAEHGVTHYYEFIYGAGPKPVAIVLVEPDVKEMKFLMPTDKVKTTEVKL